MPSVSYRAPLLVVSDLGAVAVLRLRELRTRRGRRAGHGRSGTRRPAACAVAEPRRLRWARRPRTTRFHRDRRPYGWDPHSGYGAREPEGRHR